MKNTRPYVGIRVDNGKREGFRFTVRDAPTQETHGRLYAAVIGPFRTVRAARLMADHGANNPHLQTVNDAEWYARRDATRERNRKRLVGC